MTALIEDGAGDHGVDIAIDGQGVGPGAEVDIAGDRAGVDMEGAAAGANRIAPVIDGVVVPTSLQVVGVTAGSTPATDAAMAT